MPLVLNDVLAPIEAHALANPRGLQLAPGVSDLAGECDHCLAAKLAGWRRSPDVAWLAYVGTAIHAHVEQAFVGDEWAVEQAVSLGQLGDWEITGHIDLFHIPTQTVVDFKTAGVGVLREARAGRPSQRYLAQVNLYALASGADRVALCYLPRNAPSLREAVWIEQAANYDLAYELLERAQRLLDVVTLERESQSVVIPLLPRAVGCYDCARFADAPGPAALAVEPGAVLNASLMK